MTQSPDPLAARLADPLGGCAALASHLAARLCHDLISPAGAIVSALDLMDEPGAESMRDDALGLIRASARRLTALLAFARLAYGGSASPDEVDGGEMEAAARGLYAGARPQLEWGLEPGSLARPAGRIVLGLSQLGLALLPLGGVARLTLEVGEAGLALRLRAEGDRARLASELRAGLEGRPPGEALPGRWVLAYYLHTLVTDLGGRLETLAGPGAVAVTATLPR